jgi:hypothetical protein
MCIGVLLDPIPATSLGADQWGVPIGMKCLFRNASHPPLLHQIP